MPKSVTEIKKELWVDGTCGDMVDLVILLSTKVQILKSKSFDLGLEIFDFDFRLDNIQTIGSELYDIRFNQFVLTIIIRAFDSVKYLVFV